RRSEEATVPRFLFSYRVPKDYRPGRETGQAWEAWFESLGSSRSDTGYAVAATRTLGNLDAQTRLGGSSGVTAENIEAAAGISRPPAGGARGNRRHSEDQRHPGGRNRCLRLSESEP